MIVKSAVTLLAGGQARRMGGGDKNLMMLLENRFYNMFLIGWILMGGP